MKKSYKPGDRYQCSNERDIWEILEESIKGDDCFCECVEEGLNTFVRVGGKACYSFRLTNWQYLGNFSKSTNFNSIYEKLSGT